MLRVLVVGGGGREHALIWKLAQSPKVRDLFCAPGNAGTASAAQNVPIKTGDHLAIRDWCLRNRVDLVIVGPDDPIAAGIADVLRGAGVKCFAPSAAAARIESSKAWAKQMMVRAGIPTAPFEIFSVPAEALAHVRARPVPMVVKADGLALGKGVVVARTVEAAEEAVGAMMLERRFGEAGGTVIVEDCIAGAELSAFAATDGRSLKMFPCARDYKRAYDGDEGPNTGSMGCYSPVRAADANLMAEIEARIMRPAIDCLREMGTPFVGFLYAGLMLTDNGPQVLEFNARLGDPETQAVLPLLDVDLAELALLALEGRIDEAEAAVIPGSSCCVVMASGGYPAKYETGHPISGLDSIGDAALVFHAGTAWSGGVVQTSGGRVLSVVGLGADVEQAREKAYSAIKRLSFRDAFFRTDIGALDPERTAVQ